MFCETCEGLRSEQWAFLKWRHKKYYFALYETFSNWFILMGWYYTFDVVSLIISSQNLCWDLEAAIKNKFLHSYDDTKN